MSGGQQPSVGRVVHYTPIEQEIPGEFHTATIAYVNDGGGNGSVNLAVLDRFAGGYPALYVEHTEAKAGTEEARGKWSWPAFVPPKPAEVKP